MFAVSLHRSSAQKQGSDNSAFDESRGCRRIFWTWLSLRTVFWILLAATGRMAPSTL
jgi:hypothetical protein